MRTVIELGMAKAAERVWPGWSVAGWVWRMAGVQRRVYVAVSSVKQDSLSGE